MIKDFFKDLLEGVAAGVLISIGGAIFLALSENKYVGACLFSVALLCICFKGYNLFTGKVGFMVYGHDKKAFLTLFAGLIGNVVGTLVFGLALSFALPDLNTQAEVLCNAKFTQELYQTLIRAIFCGILMYLAVSIFKENKTVVGIIFCIPVFILAGFEHSIADMAYFATARIFTHKALLFIATVVLGNAIGGMLLPALTLLSKKKDEIK